VKEVAPHAASTYQQMTIGTPSDSFMPLPIEDYALKPGSEKIVEILVIVE
jgi:hypothetical protein